MKDILNARAICFPSSIKKLVWNPKFELENSQLYAEHLSSNFKQIKLRKFETDFKAFLVIWKTPQKSIFCCSFKVQRVNKEGRSLLIIENSSKTNLVYLDNLRADECVIWTKNIQALKFVDKETTKVTLGYKLEGETDGLPILQNVTQLVIDYVMTDQQAKLLASIFPEFTEDQLKSKGLSRK